MNLTQHLFSFKGRIGRLAYNFPALALGIPAAIYLAMMTDPMVLVKGTKAAPGGGVPWIVLLPLLPIAWIQAALVTKRAHDLGYSGWTLVWKYINTVVMSGLFAIMLRISKSIPEAWFLILTILAGCWVIWLLASSIWLSLKLIFKAGSAAPNGFGNAALEPKWRL